MTDTFLLAIAEMFNNLQSLFPTTYFSQRLLISVCIVQISHKLIKQNINVFIHSLFLKHKQRELKFVFQAGVRLHGGTAGFAMTLLPEGHSKVKACV